jgi:hypothetical protein
MVHVTLPSYTKHLMLTKNLKIFDLGIVPTVWYFLFFYLIWELFDSVVFFVFHFIAGLSLPFYCL